MEKIELRRSWQFLLITKKLAILCHHFKILMNLGMNSQCLTLFSLVMWLCTLYYGWYDSLQVGPQDYSVGASSEGSRTGS